MNISKPFMVGLIGLLSGILLIPSVLVGIFIMGTLQGCREVSSVWFCGIQGMLLGPVLTLGVACTILKRLQLQRMLWLIIPILAFVILLGLFALGEALRSLTVQPIPGLALTIWLIFVVLSGLLYGGLFWLFTRRSKS